MSIDDFLAEVKHEGTDAFEQFNKEETPSESPAEKEEPAATEASTDEAPVAEVAEENIPFHKHPRWIERQQELEELRAFREATEPKLTQFEKFQTQVEGKLQDQPAIPKWFETLYGPNQEAWAEYQSHEKGLREEIKSELIQAQVQEKQREEQELNYWNSWVDKEVDKLVQDPSINMNPEDKNLLISTILKYKPTDANNNYDFRAGFELMQLGRVNQPTVEVKKQARRALADTTVKVGGEPSKKDFLTSNDLRNKSWNAL